MPVTIKINKITKSSGQLSALATVFKDGDIVVDNWRVVVSSEADADVEVLKHAKNLMLPTVVEEPEETYTTDQIAAWLSSTVDLPADVAAWLTARGYLTEAAKITGAK